MVKPGPETGTIPGAGLTSASQSCGRLATPNRGSGSWQNDGASPKSKTSITQDPAKPPAEAPRPRGWLALELRKASRFVTVGIFNGITDLALFALLFCLADWHLIAAHVVAFCTAIALGFLLNKVWTFEDQSRGGEAMLRGLAFAAVSAISLGIATGTIWLAAKALPAMVAKILADLCAFAWTYAAARFMVFRQA